MSFSFSALMDPDGDRRRRRPPRPDVGTDGAGPAPARVPPPARPVAAAGASAAAARAAAGRTPAAAAAGRDALGVWAPGPVSWSPPAPKRRLDTKQLLIAGAVALLAVVAVAAIVLKPWQSPYPSKWDDRVAPSRSTSKASAGSSSSIRLPCTSCPTRTSSRR